MEKDKKDKKDPKDLKRFADLGDDTGWYLLEEPRPTVVEGSEPAA